MPYPPYVHQAYPSTRYHRTLPPVTVADPAADDALGADWADTPAAFEAAPEPEQEPAPEPATQEDASDATPVTPEPAAAPAKRKR